MQAHEEQLQRDLSLQSGRLNSSEMEASDLRCQLSTLRATLAEEEDSHSQARMVRHLSHHSASSTTPSHGLLLLNSSSLLSPAASVSLSLSKCCIPSEACHVHETVPAPAFCLTLRALDCINVLLLFSSFLSGSKTTHDFTVVS